MLSTLAEDLVPEAGDAIKKSDHIIGDWVLFHPVYTEEELHSVKVRSALSLRDATISTESR